MVTQNYSAAGGILGEGTNRWDTYFDQQESVNDYLAAISPVQASDIMMGRMIKLDELPAWRVFLPVLLRQYAAP